MRTSRITPVTPRRRSPLSPGAILVLMLVVIAGAIYFLSTRTGEVPTRTIEVDVTNAAGR
jgi:hypothetical protein